MISGGVQANPSGATVVHGSASFSQPNVNTLNITNSPGAIINWQQFGINQGELTRFIQQGANSAVLNRIIGQDPSKILGRLSSNGKVYLVNPNGIVFGQGSVVNTAGLIASTLNISNQDFINGNMRFADLKNAAEILNQGFISSSNGGEVVFVAPKITNEGTISVENGSIVLAAGRSVTINSLNYDNIEFEVQAPDNSVVNIGDMITDGGSIGVFAGSIVNKGRVSANAVTVDDAGNIVFVAQTDTVIENGTVTATSETGKGGHIEITGNRVGLFAESTVDASGATGGGEVLVGGDYQGKNPDIKNSTQTIVSEDSSIKADAKQTGEGGKVIVWSDENTYYSGDISAQGGAQSGDGGFVEVSGKKGLGFDGQIDTSAANGRIGSILLDPDNLTIQATPGSDDGAIGGVAPNIGFLDGPGTDFTIGVDVINALTGDIILQAEIDITLMAGATLNLTNQDVGTTVTFQAGGNITIDGDIVIAGGDLVLSAADPFAASPLPTATIKINGKITTNNGNVTLNTNNSTDTITVSNDINTGTGTLDVISQNNVIFNGGAFRTDTITSSNGAIIEVNGDIIFDTVTLDTNLLVQNNRTLSILNGIDFGISAPTITLGGTGFGAIRLSGNANNSIGATGTGSIVLAHVS
ncbi:MAG: filamentous hemagglutinin N-terminal domain-containing protein, partial [Proteobacteria bacterium]|nr:filamentous hemagglutinin N-terminal domain-containing protein [Pseudomonadota bacterium]